MCPSKRPKNNKSFEKLAQSVSAKLMIIKLTFLKEITHILNEFFKPFQVNNLMVLFLCDTCDVFETTYENVYP